MPIFSAYFSDNSQDGVLAGLKKNGLSHHNSVFVFPSNVGDHFKTTLYGRYSDKKDKNARNNALYRTANFLSDLGMPTIGAPTEGLPVLKAGDKIPDPVLQAINHLWLAAGGGFNIICANPRAPINPWPGKKNRYLDIYYAEQLQLLGNFLDSEKADINTFECEVKSLNISIKNGVTIEDPVIKKLKIDKEFAKSYKKGQLKDQLDWFNPIPRAQNPAFSNLYIAQEKSRRWKTALAVIATIIFLPFAPLWYYLWKKAKERELIKAVEVKPLQLAALSQFRRDLLDKSAVDKPTEAITLNLRPQKTYTSPAAAEKALTDPEATVTVFMDKFGVQRFNFFNEAMQKNRTAPLTAAEYQQVQQWNKESIDIVPTLAAYKP